MKCRSVDGRRAPDVRGREDETGLWREPPGTWRWRLDSFFGARALEAVLPSRYPDGPGVVHPHLVFRGCVAGERRPRWEWNGDENAPTLSPSVLVETLWGPESRRVFWHGYVRGGRFEACE